MSGTTMYVAHEKIHAPQELLGDSKALSLFFSAAVVRLRRVVVVLSCREFEGAGQQHYQRIQLPPRDRCYGTAPDGHQPSSTCGAIR